ncbi:4-hydroxymandelate oxidase [Sagittula marina]|uniref:4-hydroxymandelate oxidase n=1 Tax=Sagittula marina TaxID=943940 RepID=A0A7W6DJK6_9RHOB|nr:alpha-hydroxy acid oxidase [Sagittula marina]MBB3983962.1 4-hydroxymandelate oxidase [Sagittula marina]
MSASDLPAGLPDYAARAQAMMSDVNRAYFLSGAGAETTLRANEADLAALTLRPRALRDLRGGHTQTTLLGRRLPHPILVAPFAYQSLLSPDGECATAQGAEAQQATMILSAQSSEPMQDVRASGAACRWFQLYWQATLDGTLTLANRAAEAGFEALVLTIDAPVNGIRDAEVRAGFHLPEGTRPVNLTGLPQPRFAPLTQGESMIFDRIAHILPRWEDVAALCKASPLPILIKGVLCAEDARAAVAAGAAGVIVSNHGGRVLDGACSSISVLPEVVAAVGAELPVLMDGGLRRGADVFKALALGAQAVLVGRPVIHGLTVAGALGVSHVLRLLRDELEVAMALTGCRTLDEITADRVGTT